MVLVWNNTQILGFFRQNNLDLVNLISKSLVQNLYVKNISLLMDSADLYVTKPGGISVTEAADKNLPMVIINAVAGCETYNRDFFIHTGGAVTGESVEELAAVCISLLEDDQRRNKMADAFSRREKVNAAEKIYCDMKEALQGEPCQKPMGT